MSVRRRPCHLCVLSLMVCSVLLASVTGLLQPVPTSAHMQRVAVTDENMPVLTYKYDNQRTGSNLHETLLTISNVNSQQFGPLISYPVDGQIYGQPLYVPDVTVGNATRNLVFVVTERNSAYAFDADPASTSTDPIWQNTFLSEDTALVSAHDLKCSNVTPVLGITSTPVIDRVTDTLFLVSYANENNAFIYKLHALDLATGHEKAGSPLTVRKAGFNGALERQRAGLLLSNGRIYLAFGSFCDRNPYHGWIISYSYDGSGFHLRNAYNDTPTGKEGGIWSGGSAIAADTDGNVYAITGNGTFNLNQGGPDAGDSFLKLNPGLRLVDYFAPFNQSCLAAKDKDLGSGGPLIAPGGWLIGGGKQGSIYVLNTHNLGHFRDIPNPCAQQETANLNAIRQEFVSDDMHPIFSTPVYWRGPGREYVFVARVKDHTQAFTFSQGHLSGPTSVTPETFIYSGGNPVVSSNGSTPGTGILWTIVDPGYLRAYDATDLSHELYSDHFDGYNKFVPPVVTNGKVFVATQNALRVYGLLKSAPPTAPEQPTPQPGQPGQPVPTSQVTPPVQPAQPVPTLPPEQTLQTDMTGTRARLEAP